MDHGSWMRLAAVAACFAASLPPSSAKAGNDVYVPFIGTPAAAVEGSARLYAAGSPGPQLTQAGLSLPSLDGRTIKMRLIGSFADGQVLPDGSHAEIDTRIGRVENAPGAPYAVITWSDDAIFGFIPQSCDANVPCETTARVHPPRITARSGQPDLVVTSADDDVPVVRQHTDAFLLQPSWRDADAKPSPTSGIGSIRSIRLAFDYSQAVVDAIGSLNELQSMALPDDPCFDEALTTSEQICRRSPALSPSVFST